MPKIFQLGTEYKVNSKPQESEVFPFKEVFSFL